MSNPPRRPRLGISSCLLGSNVRYDGGHKRNAFLLETLGRHVDWVSVCPEVDIGLGTPRPPIQLVRDAADGMRLVMPETGEDLTDRITRYARDRVSALRESRLSGYVLKSRSPSCGLELVPVHSENGNVSAYGVGMFATVLIQDMPQLPIEEEGRLDDPRVRENFVARIFSRARWLELEGTGFTLPGLIRFHSRHRFLLMSRDLSAVDTLDRLLDEADETHTDIGNLAASYNLAFNDVMGRLPNSKGHAEVLQLVADRVSNYIDVHEQAELRQAVHNYRTGVVSLSTPVKALRMHVHKHGIAALADQVYLEPHPDELKLLDHV